MKTHEYIEGGQALGNFKEGMKALFKIPKEKVAKAKKKKAYRPSQTKKPKLSDKD
jgi:hypothetical protein